MTKHRFSYRWFLKDGYPASGIEAHGKKVFGTFICGGGSSMGYKLAGYNHIGGVEIDPRMSEIYQKNHSPDHLFVEDIRVFNKRADLPDELYDLDLLDGSPPCSSFSVTGNREKDWGKKKRFGEGQAPQRLDDLFFDYIYLAKKLQPKIVVAENVTGLIKGNARWYAKEIKNRFHKAGYQVQLFLLNAATMGVSQMRERVFFICRRNDLNLPPLELDFNEPSILVQDVLNSTYGEDDFLSHSDLFEKYYHEAGQGGVVGKYRSGCRKLRLKDVCFTITAQGGYTHFHPTEPRQLSRQELCMFGSFPIDFDFCNARYHYVIGMSVPPVMMANLSYEIYLQWLKNI